MIDIESNENKTPLIFNKRLPKHSAIRNQITNAYRMDETAAVEALLANNKIPAQSEKHILQRAEHLVENVRKSRLGGGGLDAFLIQYDLSSEEGVALMCLAEALLRVPDKLTIDRLIKDKVSSGNWGAYRGQSESSFVNAATWGLMLTGKLLKQNETKPTLLARSLKGLVKRSGEPIIRKAVGEAMKILGKQFVRGHTIAEALSHAPKREAMGYRFSYDMLGEVARTTEDAERYWQAYADAIKQIGHYAKTDDVIVNPGISVKLSALHPRYEFSQRDTVVPILIDRVLTLAIMAKEANIGFTVDAEEADRLGMSLDIIHGVFTHPSLGDWEGFGLAVQAYQKRAPFVLDWIVDLCRDQKRRMMVRLVKGAYWDTEIKDSQVNGYENYPVFTRKASTDVSYLVCAQKMIAAKNEIYSQFATHNAHTVATLMELMGDRRDYEFQCLQGMGRTLYDQIVGKDNDNIPCRIYAPVGQHRDLLAYLVRRLLENGANTSFVNRIVDEKLPVHEIIADPIEKIRNLKKIMHPHIPLPENIFGLKRKNASGIDLSDLDALKELGSAMDKASDIAWVAKPLIAHAPASKQAEPVINPADNTQIIGQVINATSQDVEMAIAQATTVCDEWNNVTVQKRAACLQKAADLFEEHMPELMAIVVKEAGKTIPDAVAEVREAVDFCRYYAKMGKKTLKTMDLPGPTGEINQLQMHGRGVIACISPWNFPLAIFTGQITAALVAGNAVIAKPAEQAPLIAARAVELLHEAGIPEKVLQLLPGSGEIVGAALTKDPRINGVMFTGSTDTARLINQTLAEREGPIVPLIAETGGQNAMIADSTALPEQLVMDVITSAFGSAGQRCSALRVLFIQEDVADRTITMLKGAMAELRIGDPGLLHNDIGPVIDEDAKAMLEAHAQRMDKEARLIYKLPEPHDLPEGTFFTPRVYEIPSIDILPTEIFGPFLHVVRYKADKLDQVINAINNTGYGLTLGIHTRIDEVADYIQQRVKAGNAYVNRNMIGAVVGVQPFGGEGLSGTGPKAGGPHYLARLCTERTFTVNTAATGGNATLMTLGE